jgi:Conserved hypothetical ATP binding protein
MSEVHRSRHADSLTVHACEPLQVCAVYCLDSQFVTEANKFIAGSLQVSMTSQHVVNICASWIRPASSFRALCVSPQALAAMVQLEVPHISVLTKVDLLQDKVQWRLLLAARGAAEASAVLCI